MSPPKKFKPSGAQFRKQRAKQQGTLDKFLKPTSKVSSSSSDHSETETETIQAATAREDSRDVEEAGVSGVDIVATTATSSENVFGPSREAATSGSITSEIVTSSEDIITSEMSATMPTTSSEEDTITTTNSEIDFNNPSTWDLNSDSLRCLLFEHGPCQHLSSFDPSESELDGHRFSLDWFKERLPNGQEVPRLWLMYCSAKKAVFCFPCILFPESGGQESCPAICDPNKGYNAWSHLSGAISQHETSPAHKLKYLQWKTFERDLKMGKVVDQSLQDAVSSEEERWRHYLKVILHSVLFCAENNLALCGTGEHEAIEQPRPGHFLSAVKLISNFETELKRLQRHQKGDIHYLSPAIQNEFINLLAKKVRAKIMEKVKAAKYYSIQFGSTPDVSHKDQVFQILRYVHITEEGNVSVEESFIDLIEAHEKTGVGLADEFMRKLEEDGLDLQDIRGQGYDSGASMAGKYSGVQAHFLQRNNFAVSAPYTAHSLNLVLVNAAASCREAELFVETVQSFYTFFSSSVPRWTVLTSFVKRSPKRHADTHWCSEAAAVRALCFQLKDVIGALKYLSAGSADSREETVSTADHFVKQMDYQFVCLLVFWNKTLNHVDRINKGLQSKHISVQNAKALLGALKGSMQRIRNSDLTEILKEARDVATSAEIECEFPETKSNKVKRMSDESDYDEMPEDPLQAFRIVIYGILDKFIAELSRRYCSMKEIANDFGFLFKIRELDTKELCKCATDLGLKYNKDVDAYEMGCEMEDLKMTLTDSFVNEWQVDVGTPEGLLQFLYSFPLFECFPNIAISLRMFLSLPVTSCETSFSKLKLIKNYLRSPLSQDQLSGLAMVSIEHDLTTTVNFDDVIDDFASVKSRRVPL